MRLCFDATRFGFSLEEAVELAAALGVAGVDFTFAPFAVGGRAACLSKREASYLSGVAELAGQKQIEIVALNLSDPLDPEDGRSARRFSGMVAKLSAAGSVLGARYLGFWASPGNSEAWLANFRSVLSPALACAQAQGVRLLARLSTPACFQGRSLKGWRPACPDDCRMWLSEIAGLSLAFSPGDFLWQNVDYLKAIPALWQAIDHVEARDVEVSRAMLADTGLFGPLWWRYRVAGCGQVDWRQLIETLKLYDYQGYLSLSLDDEFIGAGRDELESALAGGLSVLAPLVRG